MTPDHSVLIAWITFGGVLLTAIGIYLGARLTARVAAKGQKDTNKVAETKVNAEAYTSAREIWGSLIDDLQDQLKGYREELRMLRERIESLEQSRNLDRLAIRKRDEYIAVLRRLLHLNQIEHPNPTFTFEDPLI